MGLATGLVGDGILIDKVAARREFSIWILFTQETWVETTTTETRQWVALTQDAAEAAVVASEDFTYSAEESVREVGSYSVKKITVTKTYAKKAS
jgi:hypothetical protein